MSGAQWSAGRLYEIETHLFDAKHGALRGYDDCKECADARDALRAFARVLGDLEEMRLILGAGDGSRDAEEQIRQAWPHLADALDVTPPRREDGGVATAEPDGLRDRQPERPRSSREAPGSAPLLITCAACGSIATAYDPADGWSCAGCGRSDGDE